MEWVFQSLLDQWHHGRFSGEGIALRDITGRVELKGIGYVDVALYKRGLLNWIQNKKMDDYPAWPADQKLKITKCWSSHKKFRTMCGFSPDPTKSDPNSDLTWLGTLSKSLARLHGFVEATTFKFGLHVHLFSCFSSLSYSQSTVNEVCSCLCRFCNSRLLDKFQV